jgi:hypothetical protein
MAAIYTGKAICPVCERKVSTLIPKGGDGTGSVYHAHKRFVGGIASCPGTRRLVAPGAYVKQ